MTINEHNTIFKKELNVLLEIFGFSYKVGNLNSMFYDDVYFAKGEKTCYHNLKNNNYLPFGIESHNSIDKYSPKFELDTYSKQGYQEKNIFEICYSIEELKQILKKRFPADWNRWKRKNINILINK